MPSPQLDYPPAGGSSGGPGRPGRGSTKTSVYLLRGLGLLCVAAVSGFLWWFTHNGNAPDSPINTGAASSKAAAGHYQFQPYQGWSTEQDCAAHATVQLAKYLTDHACTNMSRALYTTKLDNGDQVIVSVVVVRMSSPQDAQGLDSLAAADGTGNVKDLVTEGTRIPNGPNSLIDGAYNHEVSGNSAIITLSLFQDNSKNVSGTDQNPTLKTGVSKEALRLGEQAPS